MQDECKTNSCLVTVPDVCKYQNKYQSILKTVTSVTVIGLFEETGDGIGHHFRLIVVKNNYSRARGVFFQTRGAGRVPYRIAMMMINAMVFAKAS